jgi:hypothetical protein
MGAIVAAAGAGPATSPQEHALPRGLGIYSQEQLQHPEVIYADLWQIRRAIDEFSVDEHQKKQLAQLAADAERELHELCVKLRADPTIAAKAKQQAKQIRETFDTKVSSLLNAAQLSQLSDQVLVLVWEELMLFNGASFLSETAPAIGLELTDEQNKKIKPLLAKADEQTDKMIREREQGQPAGILKVLDLDKPPVNVTAILRKEIRQILTDSQRQKWDKATLDQIAEMKAEQAPASQPAASAPHHP